MFDTNISETVNNLKDRRQGQGGADWRRRKKGDGG
jgi:hypothetical protein